LDKNLTAYQLLSSVYMQLQFNVYVYSIPMLYLADMVMKTKKASDIILLSPVKHNLHLQPLLPVISIGDE